MMPGTRVVLPPLPSGTSMNSSTKNQQHKQHPISSNGGSSITSTNTPNASSTVAPTTSNAANTVTWRKRGEQLRALLLQQDEQMQNGGGDGSNSNSQQTFILSSSVPIYRYYEVADKVFDQFLHHPIDSREELLESYMVGQRLIKFISVILPTHNEYYMEHVVANQQARQRSLEQLNVVTKYIDQIALLIDKQEHEDYISSVIQNNSVSHNTCEHAEEKSNKLDTSIDRESTYYVDDVDDNDVYHKADSKSIDNKDVIQLQRQRTESTPSITLRGSDSTERQNNVSTNKGDSTNNITSNTTSTQGVGSEHRPPATAGIVGNDIQQNDYMNRFITNNCNSSHDNSAVSDSIDVCIVDATSNASSMVMSEDPISTPSHTIIRVVSPSQQSLLDESTNKSVNDSFGSLTSSNNTINANNGLPIVRSHWVANRPTKNYTPTFVSQSPKSYTASFADTSMLSSKDDARSVGSKNSSTETKLRCNTQTQQVQSPERSVRTIIRSWPPKQDPPGVRPDMTTTNLTNSVKRDDASSIETSKYPDSNQSLNSKASYESKRSSIQSPTADVETINCTFTPMNELQVLADEMDKKSPSRDLQTRQQEPIIRHKWPDVAVTATKEGSSFRRDPSIGSMQRVRFTPYVSSSSYSVSSCDRSNTSHDGNDSDSRMNYIQTPSTYVVSPQSSTLHEFSSKTKDADSRPANDPNISLDSIGFPKVSKTSITPEGIESTSDSRVDTLETRIMQISPCSKDTSSSARLITPKCKDYSLDKASYTATNLLTGASNKDGTRNFSGNFESPPRRLTSARSEVTDSLTPKERSPPNSANQKNDSRRSAPVDLDESISSYDAKSLNTSTEKLPTSRGFATDGLDYMLPLPKNESSATKKDTSKFAPYAPSAADWSLDDEVENSNKVRFARENSTISIDSTEFTGRSEIKERGSVNDDRKFENISPLLSETMVGRSNDWSPVWNPREFDSLFENEKGVDRSTTSTSVGRPDLSYEAWDNVWNDAMKRKKAVRSVDSRKEIVAKSKSLQGTVTPTTDRTYSTGSSQSTTTNRSRDVSSDFGQSPTKTLSFDPFASRSPVEAPFLREEKESSLMIDSKTEQRLRVATNSNSHTTNHSSTDSLHLAPTVGLYGGLKGFHSLNCAVPPFDQDDDTTDRSSRGNIMLCRSRATNTNLTTNQRLRTPNDEDWEESSLLMVDQNSGQKFKNCVRFLLK